MMERPRRGAQPPPDDRTLRRWERGLTAAAPIIGTLRRRLSMRRLVRHRDVPSVVPILARTLDHTDPQVAARARSALVGVSSTRAVDALCEEAILAPTGRAARLCVRTGVRPGDEERCSLFLLVTGQLDAYFEDDHEFQNLRLEYERADEALKRHILVVLRSGDERCLPFFTTRKALVDCSDEEIRVALRSFARHGDWTRLFQAFLELPLRHTLPFLRPMARSGWQPDEPEAKSLLTQATADLGDHIPPSPGSSRTVSPLLTRWIEVGREEPLASASTDELLEQLEHCSPPEGVRIVGTLEDRVCPGSEASLKVEHHRHWLVRLAGWTTGLCVRLQDDHVEDPVHWVRSLAPEYHVLHLPPGRATPALLEALTDAAAGTWEGPLGMARKILEALMAYRITAGSFDEMIVEVEAFDGEFEPIPEVEWVEDQSPSGDAS